MRHLPRILRARKCRCHARAFARRISNLSEASGIPAGAHAWIQLTTIALACSVPHSLGSSMHIMYILRAQMRAGCARGPWCQPRARIPRRRLRIGLRRARKGRARALRGAPMAHDSSTARDAQGASCTRSTRSPAAMRAPGPSTSRAARSAHSGLPRARARRARVKPARARAARGCVGERRVGARRQRARAPPRSLPARKRCSGLARARTHARTLAPATCLYIWIYVIAYMHTYIYIYRYS